VIQIRTVIASYFDSKKGLFFGQNWVHLMVSIWCDFRLDYHQISMQNRSHILGRNRIHIRSKMCMFFALFWSSNWSFCFAQSWAGAEILRGWNEDLRQESHLNSIWKVDKFAIETLSKFWSKWGPILDQNWVVFLTNLGSPAVSKSVANCHRNRVWFSFSIGADFSPKSDPI